MGMSDVGDAFHATPNGDRWLLTPNPADGLGFVRHVGGPALGGASPMWRCLPSSLPTMAARSIERCGT